MDIICCYSWADTVWIFIKPACCFKGPICKKSGCLSLIPNSLNTAMTGMTLWVSHLVENWRFGIVGWISRHPKASVYDELGIRLFFFTNRTFNLHYTISIFPFAGPEPTTFMFIPRWFCPVTSTMKFFQTRQLLHQQLLSFSSSRELGPEQNIWHTRNPSDRLTGSTFFNFLSNENQLSSWSMVIDSGFKSVYPVKTSPRLLVNVQRNPTSVSGPLTLGANVTHMYRL